MDPDFLFYSVFQWLIVPRTLLPSGSVSRHHQISQDIYSLVIARNFVHHSPHLALQSDRAVTGPVSASLLVKATPACLSKDVEKLRRGSIESTIGVSLWPGGLYIHSNLSIPYVARFFGLVREELNEKPSLCLTCSLPDF